MQVLKTVTLDKLINLYEGQVVLDRKQVMLYGEFEDDEMSELKKRCLKEKRFHRLWLCQIFQEMR